MLGGGPVLKRVQHYVLVKHLDLQKMQASGKWCVICFCIASYCLPSLLSQVPWQIAMSLSRTGQSTSWRQGLGAKGHDWRWNWIRSFVHRRIGIITI